jgi:hypothetical protein
MNTLVKLAQLEATMLEVSRAIQISRAAVADRVDQERCERCSRLDRPCTPIPGELNNPTSQCKCVTCRASKVPCSWGPVIPRCLNEMKAAIHRSRERGASEEPVKEEMIECPVDRGNDPRFWDRGFLENLQKVIALAFAVAAAEIGQREEEQVFEMLECFSMTQSG